MERICIIGGSGTGKSTLSTNLGKELNLPVFHIDGINYLENWKQRDQKERDKIILETTNEPKWIMDGTYRSTLEQRLERSDFIIFLDFSSLTQIISVMKRYLKNRGKEKKDIPNCEEKMSWEFFWFVIMWRKNKRKYVLEKLNKVDQKKVHIFSNRKELNKWYENTFGKKINY